MASSLGPILFVVIVVGGLGSLSGAFVASLLIGVVQTFAVAMNVSLAGIFGPAAPPFLGDLWQVTVAELAPVIPYVLLVLMLIVRPTGLMGTREIMMSAMRSIAPWLAIAVVFVAAPHVFASGSALTMMSVMGTMIIFALSYNMLLGQTGLLSFGHAVYFGLGGFVAIHAMNAVIHARLNVPVPVIPLVGGLAGLGFGFLFGLVSTKRAGIVFSMISLGIGELVSSSSFILRTFFGGEEGITTTARSLRPSSGTSSGSRSRSIISSRRGASFPSRRCTP